MVLEKIYREVLEGKTLAEAHGGIIAGAKPAVRRAVRDYIMFRAQREPPEGPYRLDLAALDRKLGVNHATGEKARERMKQIPEQFRTALLNTEKLEEIGGELDAGRMHPLLADRTHWTKKHWEMVSALATAEHTGYFENSETNPLHYLIKRRGRKALKGLTTPGHILTLASRLGVGLRTSLPPAQLSAEQREFIEAFGKSESDAEIARALRLPTQAVTSFRGRTGVTKAETDRTRETKNAAAGAMREILASNPRPTDEQLRAHLKTRGITLARRTVNKYRRLLTRETK
ncbi:MAG: hypothetical protein AB1626_02220 [Candidatus Micrarchaeota archaeon]